MAAPARKAAARTDGDGTEDVETSEEETNVSMESMMRYLQRMSKSSKVSDLDDAISKKADAIEIKADSAATAVAEALKEAREARKIAEEARTASSTVRPGSSLSSAASSVGGSRADGISREYSEINSRKIIIGGFPEYSEQDEMEPFVDLILGEQKSEVQIKFLSSPGNHASVVMKTVSVMWSVINRAKQLAQSQALGGTDRGKAVYTVGQVTNRLWVKKHRSVSERDEWAKLQCLAKAMSDLEGLQRESRIIGYKKEVIIDKKPRAKLTEEGKPVLYANALTQAMVDVSVNQQGLEDLFKLKVDHLEASRFRRAAADGA